MERRLGAADLVVPLPPDDLQRPLASLQGVGESDGEEQAAGRKLGDLVPGKRRAFGVLQDHFQRAARQTPLLRGRGPHDRHCGDGLFGCDCRRAAGDIRRRIHTKRCFGAADLAVALTPDDLE